jgi:hypothetical protein
MQRSETKEINGHNYQCTQFSASKGLKMLHRLGKILGPSLSSLAGMNSENLQADMLGSAIGSLFANCSEAEFETTVKELLTTTTIDGRAINFDLDFAGDLGSLFKLLAFVLKVQYGNFFDGLPGIKR